MKTFVVRLWRKPWGKVFFAILYSLATILVYFGVALVLFAAFRTTIIPAIGQAPRQDASSDSQVSPEEMKRLTTYIPFIPSRPTNSTPQVNGPR